MLKSLVLGAALVGAGAASVQAQTIVDANNVDEILNLAREHGSADLGKQDNGSPRIIGRIDGTKYVISFMNCADPGNCTDIQFYAGFLDNKPTLEMINAWNVKQRFGKAYLDDDRDAVIELDVNLEHGVTAENLAAAFSLWRYLVDEYATYIGRK